MRRSLLLALIAAGPLAGQTVPKKQLVEEVRLDANTEDFPDVGSVLVNARGEMAVLVYKDQQLRFYDATGKKLGTFGRVGSGPGEFRRANTAGWVGDTLWLYDVDLRRVTYISPARQLLRSEVLNQSLNSMGGYAPGTTPPPTRPAPPADGAIMLFSVRAVRGDKYIGTAAISKGKLPDGRQDSKSVIAAVPRMTAVAPDAANLTPAGDTVASKTYEVLADWQLGNSMSWSRPDGKASASAVVPFTFSPWTQFSPDGARIAYLTVEPTDVGGTYTLKVTTTAGAPLLTRAYPFKGLPIPRSVVDSVLEHFGEQPNGRPIFQPEAMALFKDQLPKRMPKFYSPVSRVHLGAGNATWIQMRRPDPKAPATLVLIDDRGNQVASVELPPRHNVLAISRDQLWAQVLDDDDLPSVVRYRIK